MKKTLTQAAKIMSHKEADKLSVEKLEMLDSLTGLKLRIRIAQSKLVSSKCLGIVLTYIKPLKLIALQILSKRFYETVVPEAITFVG